MAGQPIPFPVYRCFLLYSRLYSIIPINISLMIIQSEWIHRLLIIIQWTTHELVVPGVAVQCFMIAHLSSASRRCTSLMNFDNWFRIYNYRFNHVIGFRGWISREDLLHQVICSKRLQEKGPSEWHVTLLQWQFHVSPSQGARSE